jgi:hypothetical protein
LRNDQHERALHGRLHPVQGVDGGGGRGSRYAGLSFDQVFGKRGGVVRWMSPSLWKIRIIVGS